MKQHKPGCMANIKCAVYHADGICPGPYGICTCDTIESNISVPIPTPPHQDKEAWELPKRFKFIADEYPDFEEDLRSLLHSTREETIDKIKEFRHEYRNLHVSSDFDIAFDEFISTLSTPPKE